MLYQWQNDISNILISLCYCHINKGTGLVYKFVLLLRGITQKFVLKDITELQETNKHSLQFFFNFYLLPPKGRITTTAYANYHVSALSNPP